MNKASATKTVDLGSIPVKSLTLDSFPAWSSATNGMELLSWVISGSLTWRPRVLSAVSWPRQLVSRETDIGLHQPYYQEMKTISKIVETWTLYSLFALPVRKWYRFFCCARWNVILMLNLQKIANLFVHWLEKKKYRFDDVPYGHPVALLNTVSFYFFCSRSWRCMSLWNKLK